MDTQYYCLIRNPHFERVFNWVFDNNIPYELHANRIRFRPHSERVLVEFALRYADYCDLVDKPYPSHF